MTNNCLKLTNSNPIANSNGNDLEVQKDRASIGQNAFLAHKVAEKWFIRGYEDVSKIFEDLAFELGFNNPNEAEGSVADLIYAQKFIKAEEYGKKLLEKWSKESDEKILEKQTDENYLDTINNKMALAIKINSQSYYYFFRNKLIDVNIDYIVHNYYKYFENKSLKSENKDLKISDYLINRTYIDSDFLIEHKLTINQAREKLIEIVCDLQKTNEIIFSMLQAICLYAKEDPYFQLHIFNKLPITDNFRAHYWPYWNFIEISKFSLESYRFKEILMHEICHKLIHFLFSKDDLNDCLLICRKRKKHFKRIVKETKLYLKRYKDIDNDYGVFVYTECFELRSDDICNEFLPNFVHAITNLEYTDIKKQRILAPIYSYWMKYIQPRIKQYIKESLKN